MLPFLPLLPRSGKRGMGSDFFTAEGMPRTAFPKGWKGENGLYTVGFTRRGLLGASADAIKIAGDIAHQWKTTKETDIFNNSHFVLVGRTHQRS